MTSCLTVWLNYSSLFSENLNWTVDDMTENLGIIFLKNKKLHFKVRIVFKKTGCQSPHVLFSEVALLENSIQSSKLHFNKNILSIDLNF